MTTTTAVLDVYRGMNTHPLPLDAYPVAFLFGDEPEKFKVVVQYVLDGSGLPVNRDANVYFLVRNVAGPNDEEMLWLGALTSADGKTNYFAYWGR